MSYSMAKKNIIIDDLDKASDQWIVEKGLDHIHGKKMK